MRIFLILFFLFHLGIGFAQTPDLMPLPASYKLADERFDINATFNIEIIGDVDASIYKEASRFFQRLSERTGIFFKSWIVTPNNKISTKGLLIKIKSKGTVALGMDESYELHVGKQNIIIELNGRHRFNLD